MLTTFPGRPPARRFGLPLVVRNPVLWWRVRHWRANVVAACGHQQTRNTAVVEIDALTGHGTLTDGIVLCVLCGGDVTNPLDPRFP